MVELIYTDNVRGRFVAHGAGTGAMVPMEVFVRRRPLIALRVAEEGTGADLTDSRVPFRVYRVTKRRLGRRFRHAVTEEHELLFSGVTGSGAGKGLRDDGSDLSSMFVEASFPHSSSSLSGDCGAKDLLAVSGPNLAVSCAYLVRRLGRRSSWRSSLCPAGSSPSTASGRCAAWGSRSPPSTSRSRRRREGVLFAVLFLSFSFVSN